jgi:hypothetical protein
MPECRGSRRNSFYLENFATLSCKWVLYSCHYARNYECNIEPGVILAAEKPAIRATPPDGVNFIPYMMLLGVE